MRTVHCDRLDRSAICLYSNKNEGRMLREGYLQPRRDNDWTYRSSVIPLQFSIEIPHEAAKQYSLSRLDNINTKEIYHDSIPISCAHQQTDILFHLPMPVRCRRLHLLGRIGQFVHPKLDGQFVHPKLNSLLSPHSLPVTTPQDEQRTRDKRSSHNCSYDDSRNRSSRQTAGIGCHRCRSGCRRSCRGCSSSSDL